MHARTASHVLAAVLLGTAAAGAASCTPDAPTGSRAAAPGPGLHRSAGAPELAQQLSALRRLTAPYHSLRKAHEAGYTVEFPCVSDPALGGMGVHYAHQDLSRLSDDRVSLLEPEFLVYAPDDKGELAFAALDYFVPYSRAWPSPENGGEPPTLLGMEFRPSARFQAWIFHIWLWRNNPAGMFVDFNPAVPLCDAASAAPPHAH